MNESDHNQSRKFENMLFFPSIPVVSNYIDDIDKLWLSRDSTASYRYGMVNRNVAKEVCIEYTYRKHDGQDNSS